MSRRVNRVRLICSSWLIASGMESSHLGFAGTVQVPQRRMVTEPPGDGVDGFARAEVSKFRLFETRSGVAVRRGRAAGADALSAAGAEPAGHTSHLEADAEPPTDPADRTGTIGVESELVEAGGAFVAQRPTDADRPAPRRLRRRHPAHRGEAD